jgi:hypothetical protein
VPGGLVLDMPSALVELGVGEFADVERISHQGGSGNHDLEHPPVGTGEVDGAELDVLAKGPALSCQPADGIGTARPGTMSRS